MDHTLLVRIVNRVAHLREEFQALAKSQPPTLCVPQQKFPRNVLHGEEGSPVSVRSRFVDLRDSRVIELTENLDLEVESLEC